MTDFTPTDWFSFVTGNTRQASDGTTITFVSDEHGSRWLDDKGQPHNPDGPAVLTLTGDEERWLHGQRDGGTPEPIKPFLGGAPTAEAAVPSQPVNPVHTVLGAVFLLVAVALLVMVFVPVGFKGFYFQPIPAIFALLIGGVGAVLFGRAQKPLDKNS